VLHLESLLEKYKTEFVEGDSTDKEAHAARKDKVKHVKRIINTEGKQKPYRIIKSVMKPAPSAPNCQKLQLYSVILMARYQKTNL
jgi:hypothetical protein